MNDSKTTKTYDESTKIVVIGVSHNPEKYGNQIFSDLVANNYTVLGINPKGGSVANQKLATSLEDPEFTTFKPELALFVVPPAIGSTLLKSITAQNIPTIWLQPGASNPELITQARKLGLTVHHTQCFMKQQGLW